MVYVHIGKNLGWKRRHGSISKYHSRENSPFYLEGFPEEEWWWDENYRTANALLCKEDWCSYKDSVGFAQYAVGAPTMEQFVASYNAKYPEDRIYFEWVDAGFEGDDGYPGYNAYVAWTDTSEKVWDPVTKPYIEGFEGLHVDNFYTLLDTSEVTRYFLASPGQWETMLYAVWYDGWFCGTQDTFGNPGNPGGSTGVRPVICINSNVLAEKEGTSWTLFLE